MLSFWISWVVPKSNDIDPHKKQKRHKHAEQEATWRRRQRNAQSLQIGSVEEGLSLKPLREHSPADTLTSAQASGTAGEESSVILSRQIHGSLLQQP